MLSFVITIIIIIFFLFLDFIPMYDRKQWLLLAAYSVMMAAVAVFSLLLALNIKLPSPAGPLKVLVSVIWGIN